MEDWYTDALRLWAQIRGHYVRTEEGVELFHYKDAQAWDRRHPNKLAFALGPLVMFRSRVDMTLPAVRHELKHCEQIRRVGGLLRLLPRYYYEALKALVLTGDTDNNPYEKEAIAAE